MRILLTGASGLLGGYLLPALRRTESNVVPVSYTAPVADRGLVCDLTDDAATARLLAEVDPDVIVHAAALTDVDRCEAEPALADQVNRRSTELLARSRARLVFLSTDSVFDGSRGDYSEQDEPSPLNEYARSKLRAEKHVIDAGGLAIRTNFFGRSSRGHGLAEWLLRELGAGRKVIGFEDVVISPLYCADAADAITELALGDADGLLHLGGSSVNKYELALLVAQRFGLDESLVRRGSISDINLRAPRPLDTSLNSSRAQDLLGRPLRDVSAGIAAMASDSRVLGHAQS